MTEAQQGRRVDDAVRERRLGPSRLSRWNGHKVAMVSVAWIGCVVVLLALGIVVSVGEIHGLAEVRADFTRSNIIGLLAVFVVPPACLTMQWWLMRDRRRRRPGDGRHSE